jgi:hypothetical protein
MAEEDGARRVSGVADLRGVDLVAAGLDAVELPAAITLQGVDLFMMSSWVRAATTTGAVGQ